MDLSPDEFPHLSGKPPTGPVRSPLNRDDGDDTRILARGYVTVDWSFD